MALLDRVRGDENLYIGGMFSLRRKDALKRANITHVLSVLCLPLDKELFAPYKHMVVEVDDVEDENLLEHFTTTNGFIEEGLEGGGGVLVHCAMGKSRSATCVLAYLIQKYRITPQEALEQLQLSRPICEPNLGFMQQLELYYQWQAPVDLDSEPAYQRWVYKREVELSIACGKAPDKSFDVVNAGKWLETRGRDNPYRNKALTEYHRRILATSQYLIQHNPKDTPNNNPTSALPPCSHFFLDPLSWMKAELEQGKLDGRLECPKCGANVGKYAWQGMRCSCSEWIVPGISLARGKVDEVRSQTVAVRELQQQDTASASMAGPDSPRRVPREGNL